MARRLVVNARAVARTCACDLVWQRARGGDTRRVRWLCPIHKPHNKRIQPTASLAALASRRLMREPLGCFLYLKLGGVQMGELTVPANVTWKCVNLSCGAINELEPCPNCGSTSLKTSHYKPSVGDWQSYTVICPRCDKAWKNLVCPKCGKETPVEKSGLPFNKDCFIATAVYGSPDRYEVELLRHYRDAYLLQTVGGRLIVRLYEFISPPIASWIAPRPSARRFVRQVVMLPLLWMTRRQMR